MKRILLAIAIFLSANFLQAQPCINQKVCITKTPFIVVNGDTTSYFIVDGATQLSNYSGSKTLTLASNGIVATVNDTDQITLNGGNSERYIQINSVHVRLWHHDARIDLDSNEISINTPDVAITLGAATEITVTAPGVSNTFRLTDEIIQFTYDSAGTANDAQFFVQKGSIGFNFQGTTFCFIQDSVLFMNGGQMNGIAYPQKTTASRDLITPKLTGLTLFCSDCTADDMSTGVIQTYNGSAWKNHW